MPPTWGLSGERARLQVVVRFGEGGQLDILESGVYDARVCRWDGPAGGWEVRCDANAILILSTSSQSGEVPGPPTPRRALLGLVGGQRICLASPRQTINSQQTLRIY